MSLAEVTTAHRLAAYREELTASGFSPEAAQALVVEAARHEQKLTIHPAFMALVEPVMPVRGEAAHA